MVGRFTGCTLAYIQRVAIMMWLERLYTCDLISYFTIYMFIRYTHYIRLMVDRIVNYYMLQQQYFCDYFDMIDISQIFNTHDFTYSAAYSLFAILYQWKFAIYFDLLIIEYSLILFRNCGAFFSSMISGKSTLCNLWKLFLIFVISSFLCPL